MSTPGWKPVIDTSFDVAFADQMARYETYNKHHYRPNTYLHKWWGRRCGSTFRLILKGLVDDITRAGYYAPRGLEGKVILDPMVGGGTTLHEAIRMGASVIGVDIDPIPILQARASLTERPIVELRAAFDQFYSSLVTNLQELFLTSCPHCERPLPFWYGLYGQSRRCSCSDIVMVDSLVIREQPDGSALRLCAECGTLLTTDTHECRPSGPRLIERLQTTCYRCGGLYEEALNQPYYTRYELLIMVGHCPEHGLFHKITDDADRRLRQCADEKRESLPLEPDDFRVAIGDKSIQLIRRGVNNYLDLFSSRQLIFLHEVSRRLPTDDAITRLNLALLVSTSLEFNSMLCGYKGAGQRRAGAVRHTFSHHGYSFPYTALEANPVYPRRASGTLQKLFHSRIERARLWAAAPTERVLSPTQARFAPIPGERDMGVEFSASEALTSGPQRFVLRQGSATALPAQDGSVDAIVTDPPYFDSIQYSDLAAFFRVWLRQFMPDAADWNYDGSTAAVHSERNGEDHHYERLIRDIFRECRRVLRPDTGRLVFTFHHWQGRAWAALSAALYEAGFTLLNRYVVHAEHPISVHISRMRALTHDAILVLAPGRQVDAPEWERMRPSGQDSFAFTESCATLLGWVLSQEGLDSAEIAHLWQETLGTDRPN